MAANINPTNRIDILSCLRLAICRKCSLVLPFLLILQVSFAQNDFKKTDDWLERNLPQLGGRANMVLVKDGRIIYSQSANHLSDVQKMTLQYLAKRQRKDPLEAIRDYYDTVKAPIASWSKWLSAALVMTFVDEGRLNLDDTLGRFLPVMTAHQK